MTFSSSFGKILLKLIISYCSLGWLTVSIAKISDLSEANETAICKSNAPFIVNPTIRPGAVGVEGWEIDQTSE